MKGFMSQLRGLGFILSAPTSFCRLLSPEDPICFLEGSFRHLDAHVISDFLAPESWKTKVINKTKVLEFNLVCFRGSYYLLPCVLEEKKKKGLMFHLLQTKKTVMFMFVNKTKHFSVGRNVWWESMCVLHSVPLIPLSFHQYHSLDYSSSKVSLEIG